MTECVDTAELVRRSYQLWFPEMAPGATVSEISSSKRAQSEIHRVAIDDGERVLEVIVKANSLLRAPPARPRLGLADRFETKHLLEARALALAADAVPNRAEFGTVRVLATFEQRLAMDVVEGTDLATMVRLRHGLGCETVVRNAGEWLRHFHQADGVDDLPRVRDNADALAETFERFCRFLSTDLADRSRLLPRLEALAGRIRTDLAEVEFELGLGHGDFAARNVMVSCGNRVTILDPLGCQRCPVEEDLAYFAVALRKGGLVPWLGRFSSSRARRLEEALLEGYGLPASGRLAYDVSAVLVILDSLAADFVRVAEPESRRRRLLRWTLPDSGDLLSEYLDRIDAS
jgi:aminoglycoside phosphotransferase (APT) family kinase protein